MITIITGVPGMGKTALVVDMMRKEMEKGERPFFVMGIPDLTIDHSPVPPTEEWTEKRPDPDDPSIMLDYFTFPPGSIIVIDEAQRVYRPRASTSKVPPIVAAHETHRHTGVDFWLLTQKPLLIDSHIRELCGRHIHIRNTFTGRKLFEWLEFTDVRNRSNYADAAVRRFRPPRSAFKYYKSAELHTKQPRRLHYVWIFLPLAIAFTSWKAYGVYSRYDLYTNPDRVIEQAEQTAPAVSIKTFPGPGRVQRLEPLTPEPPKLVAHQSDHPFAGYIFTILGTFHSATRDATYLRLENQQGQQVDLTAADLVDMGYTYDQPNDCSAFFSYRSAVVVAACRGQDSTPQRAVVAAAATDDH